MDAATPAFLAGTSLIDFASSVPQLRRLKLSFRSDEPNYFAGSRPLLNPFSGVSLSSGGLQHRRRPCRRESPGSALKAGYLRRHRRLASRGSASKAGCRGYAGLMKRTTLRAATKRCATKRTHRLSHGPKCSHTSARTYVRARVRARARAGLSLHAHHVCFWPQSFVSSSSIPTSSNPANLVVSSVIQSEVRCAVKVALGRRGEVMERDERRHGENSRGRKQ
eukprot:5171228-Pleurochrysis_carterae.AAC.1